MRTKQLIHVLPEMLAFVQVAELGSFSAAAAVLGLTPSAVSRQVSRLERELGVQLMQRTTRQLRLTEAGVLAFAHCSDMVTAAQATLQLTQTFVNKPHGRVRLSAPKAFARHILHPRLLGFMAAYPDVDVQVIVSDRDIDPVREGVDLVVRLTSDPPPGLVARPLMKVNQILVAAPDYLKAAPEITQPLDLVAHSCLSLGEQERDNRWRFRRGAQRLDVVVQGRYVVNHSEMRLHGAICGLGVACVPDFVARESLARGDVVRVLPEWECLGNYHGQALLLYPPSRFLPPKCRVLIDYLVDAVQHEPGMPVLPGV